MQSPSFRHVLTRAAGLSLFLAVAPTLTFAQSEAKTGPEDKVAAAKRLAMTDSQVLFAVADYDNGELVLLGSNRAKAGTAQWEVESASRLIRMAHVLAAQGRAKASAELVRRALGHLDKVGTDADDGVRGNAEELLGCIHERFGGNAEKARLAYRNALRLNPGAVQVKEALERLNRAKVLAAQTTQTGS